MPSVVPVKPLYNAQIDGSFFYIATMNYTKTCQDAKNLVALLKLRGLQIDNESLAEEHLNNIGYFRLSAYFYPLLNNPKTDHIFKAGATFDMVMTMYRFDRKLRMLLINEIEKIEVAIRSAMVNIISLELGGNAFWMTDSRYFNPTYFANMVLKIDEEIDRSNQEFIKHFKYKYTAEAYPPAWMIAEVLSLGGLCTVYRNLADPYLQKIVADYFGIKRGAFTSWVLVLANLRNNCCHHSRIWNREVALIPANPIKHTHAWIDYANTDPKRIYIRICMIKYLLFTVSPKNTFAQKLNDLLAKYPTIDVKAMGFPDNWESEPLWS